ncbi:MAG: hypothetical protein AAF903_06225 [Pseudomonadota bacterium]
MESAAIVEMICAKFALQMVPTVGTDAYIEHLELMHFAEGSAMMPILLGLYTVRLGEAADPLKPRIEEHLQSHFAFMESKLRDSGHFVLDELSAVDVMLSFPAEVAMKQGRGEGLHKLATFVDCVHGREAWKRAMEKGGDYWMG